MARQGDTGNIPPGRGAESPLSVTLPDSLNKRVAQLEATVASQDRIIDELNSRLIQLEHIFGLVGSAFTGSLLAVNPNQLPATLPPLQEVGARSFPEEEKIVQLGYPFVTSICESGYLTNLTVRLLRTVMDDEKDLPSENRVRWSHVRKVLEDHCIFVDKATYISVTRAFCVVMPDVKEESMRKYCSDSLPKGLYTKWPENNRHYALCRRVARHLEPLLKYYPLLT